MVKITKIILLAGCVVAAPIALRVAQVGWMHTVTVLPNMPMQCPTALPAVLVIGQSQAANTGQRRRMSFNSSYVLRDSSCYRLRDPIVGTDGGGGSIWTTFAETLGQPILMANMAIPGSGIGEWLMPEQMIRTREQITQLVQHSNGKLIVIWMQGESNAKNANLYEERLKQLLTLAPRAKWLITRESICYDVADKVVALDRARDSIAHKYPNVSIGPDLDKIPLGGRQADHCHLSRDQQDALGIAVAHAVRPLMN